jgi:hypothetical protein
MRGNKKYTQIGLRKAFLTDKLKFQRTKVVMEYFVYMYHIEALGKHFAPALVKKIIDILWNSRRDKCWL